MAKIIFIINQAIIATFLLQKLKLSITPFTLDDKSKTPYYERGGTAGQPGEAAISPRMSLPEKPMETNF